MDITSVKSPAFELRSLQKPTSQVEDDTAKGAKSSQVRSDTATNTSEETDVKSPKKEDASEASARSGGSESLSPAQAILKRLSEQIAELREKIAEMKAELSKAVAKSKGEPSAEVDALRNQLQGLQSQLMSLSGAYNDALDELNKSNEPKTVGSIIDTTQ